MARSRFGDTAAEREVLALPRYRRAVWFVRLAFLFWAVALGFLIAGTATGDDDLSRLYWAAIPAAPLTSLSMHNVAALHSFILGDKPWASSPAAQDLDSRAVKRVFLEALFLVRRRR